MLHQSSLGNEAIMVEAKGGDDWRPSSDRVRKGLAPANTNNTVAILYTYYTGQPSNKTKCAIGEESSGNSCIAKYVLA